MAKSKSRGSLDTNVLLRYLLGDVPHQSTAVESLLADGSVFDVADAALLEAVFVLEKFYKMERELIQDNMFTVTRNKQFACNQQLFERCMPLYVSHPSLSITDCILLTQARLNKKTPLYAFDEKLAKYSEGNAVIPA